MATYPRSGSILTVDGKNTTRTSLSTHMVIEVAGQPVGAIKSLSISEGRNISMINEVGTDGSIDSTPTSSVAISGSVNRIRYDKLRLIEAFGGGYMHLAAQRYPIDITIIDYQKESPANHVITTLKNVWFESLNFSLDADNWIITDTANFKAEQVYTHLPDGSSAANGGDGRLAQYYQDQIMVDADTGKRRGSLDASGLIDLVLDLKNIA